MRLVELAIRRPVTALMLLVSVLLIGGIALQRVPLAFLPEVDVPFIAIEIPHPNSSPRQVEDQITEPVEEALATLPGIEKLTSTSTADGASFVLEFRWGQELDVVRMQVSEKLDLVKPKLPEGARNILVASFNTADIPVVEARISAQGVDLSASYPLLEAHILDPLQRIPGVARVELDGVAPRQVFVDLVHDRLTEHRVDVGALVRRLQNASTEMVLGRVGDGRRRYTVRGLGAFENLDELGSMPIGTGDLRLRDVAEISYEEPPIAYGRHLGREYAVGLRVFKESTANTVEVVDEVTRVIEEEIAADPRLRGISLFVWENQADEIRAGIDGLQRAGLVGALMAVLCLYVFLRRLDSTLIVALSIPFSVIAACGALYFMGRTFNLLSMMGLMLGVGMLVDNSIVVLESIDRRHRVDTDPTRAALMGTRSVFSAVIAATATTLIVFMPLVLGEGTQLTTWLGEVGVTISLALACSLLSSLTLIPLMAARILKRRPPVRQPAFEWLEQKYARLLGWTLRRKKTAALLLVAAMGIGITPLAAQMVKAEPFSAHVNERLFLRYDFQDFHYKSQAEAVVSRVEDYLFEHAESFSIEDVYSFYAENEAGTVVVLGRKDLDDDAVKDLRKRIRDGLPKLPGVEVSFHEDAESGGDSTYFTMHLRGRDEEELRRLVIAAREKLTAQDGIEDLVTSFEHGRDEIEVTIDRERALRRGVSIQDASEAFGFTLGGMRLPRFRDGAREVDTWLALRIEDRASLDDLQSISFPAEDGPAVRLGDIAGFDTVQRPRAIVRENRQGDAWVRGTYEGEDWEAARKQIEETMSSLSLPTGYSWTWGDQILERDRENEQMGMNFLLALLLVYLVLAAQFESLTQPVAILFSIVFALPGMVWALVLTHTPFNLMAQIGLLILMGVVVNNGVVLLDRLNALRAQGVPNDEAIVQAGRDRLRPILMTAATTILGLLPLALGGATVGGLFYFPLARAVMGGLLSSAFLTLLALPLLTLGIEGLARWLTRLWRATASPD